MKIFKGFDAKSGLTAILYYNNFSHQRDYSVYIYTSNNEEVIIKRYEPASNVFNHIKIIHDRFVSDRQKLIIDENLIANKACAKLLKLIIKNSSVTEIYELLCRNYYAAQVVGAREVKDKFKKLML